MNLPAKNSRVRQPHASFSCMTGSVRRFYPMITSFFKPKSGNSVSAAPSKAAPAPSSDEPDAKKRKILSPIKSVAVPSSDCDTTTLTPPASSAESTVIAPASSSTSAQSAEPSFQTLETLFPADWPLQDEFQKSYFRTLKSKLADEQRTGRKIFPPLPLVFNAFQLTSFEQCRVVIIGQDPYHDNGQAHGLCFSVPRGQAVPSSLKNIYKELKSDVVGFVPPAHGFLEHWAQQGVLMLNTCLTVRAHEANSHKDHGWQTFTDAVIKCINDKKENVVFFLWGGQAHLKGAKINTQRHLVLKSPHPSGLSANRATPEYPQGYFNNHHFTKANQYLIEHGLPEVDWKLPR